MYDGNSVISAFKPLRAEAQRIIRLWKHGHVIDDLSALDQALENVRVFAGDVEDLFVDNKE